MTFGPGVALAGSSVASAQVVDRFDRPRGLACSVQGQGEGAPVLREPFGVVDDDLAGGLEPAHGQAVIVGLAARPQDGEPAGLVKARGILGAVLGDFERGRPQPRAQALVGPKGLEHFGLEQVPGKKRLDSLDRGAAERKLGGRLRIGGRGAPGLGRVVDAPRDDLAAVAADGQAEDAAGVSA